MDLSIGELFANPDHYLYLFDGDQAVFRSMDRDAYRRSIFLDNRIAAAGPGAMRIPIAPLVEHVHRDVRAPGIGWIFHVAHCGSTLLARGLDGEGGLVLREPLPLRQLAVEAANAFPGADAPAGWRDGLRLSCAMMRRRYEPDTPVLVKANVPVNFILPEIMTLEPGAKGVLLHFGWRDYLAAILRSPEHRAWLRSVTGELAPAIEAETGPIAELDDAELAAALWLAQMRIYARALVQWDGLRSLDAERLFAAPRDIIAAAAEHIGIDPADDGALAALAGSYSKGQGLAFDNRARLARREANRAALDGEIERAAGWLGARADAFCSLARPL